MKEVSLNDAKHTGFITASETGGQALRFRHVVFEVWPQASAVSLCYFNTIIYQKRKSSDYRESGPVNETVSDIEGMSTSVLTF